MVGPRTSATLMPIMDRNTLNSTWPSYPVLKDLMTAMLDSSQSPKCRCDLGYSSKASNLASGDLVNFQSRTYHCVLDS